MNNQKTTSFNHFSGKSFERKTGISLLILITLSLISTAVTGLKDCSLRVNNDVTDQENIFEFNSIHPAQQHKPSKVSIFKIELLSFTAIMNEKLVEINWTIHKEPGNVFYTIERSIDNEDYFPIGSVEGSVTPDQDISYSYLDLYPMAGVSYYRLVQTDLNGQSKFFPATVINNINSQKINLYPNPSTTGIVHLSGIHDKISPVITVRDLTGKPVPFKLSLNETGVFDITIDEYYSTRKGIFIIAINDGKQVIYHKLLIK
jgi:hypothetical protein